jgi:hypothetical protein
MKIGRKTKIVLEVLCFIAFILLVVFVIKNFSRSEDIESDQNPVSRLVSWGAEKYEDWQEPNLEEKVEASNNLRKKLSENSSPSWQDNVNIWQGSWTKIKLFFSNLFSRIKGD